MIEALRCAVCGTTVDIATPFAWKCPNAIADDPYHVLHLVDSRRPPLSSITRTRSSGSDHVSRGGRSLVPTA